MIRTAHRVALYARFSSDNQRSESIDAQVRAMKNYCKQNGYIIINTYIDEAKSATTDRRPAFQQMIADSREHIFDILLVHKLDRFARNRYDSAVYKRELKKNGVAVYSVLENLDDSPESIMMEAVLDGVNEYFSQNLAREVMKGMRETALQCKHTGGKPPLGYDIDPVSKRLVINEDEAEAVRLIFSMYSEGQGYSPILAALHEKGSKTKNGKDFQKNSLYSILTNPKYQGTYIFNRSSAKDGNGHRNTHLCKDSEDVIAIEGGCPQLVDKETFARVQQRINGNKHTGGRNNAKTNYLLSGKVFCRECGRAMVGNTRHSGKNGRLYVTYRCPSKRYNCSNKEINQEYIERYVLALLEKKIFNTAAMKQIAKRIHRETENKSNSLAEEIAAVEEKLQEIEKAITHVTDVIVSGIVSAALTEKLGELEQEKAVLDATLAKLNGPNMDGKEITVDPLLIPGEYVRLKNSPSILEYKRFVQSFIGQIEVGRYGMTLTIKTGLDVFPYLDTTLSVRREEVYIKGKQL